METLPNQNSQHSYNDGHLYVDLRLELVTLDSQVLPLTRNEYCLLVLLVQHAGEVVSRTKLSMQVWGPERGASPRKVIINIRGLRRKLGIYAARYIETVSGGGYRFRPASPSYYKGGNYFC